MREGGDLQQWRGVFPQEWCEVGMQGVAVSEHAHGVAFALGPDERRREPEGVLGW
jgi:hypothetical protein